MAVGRKKLTAFNSHVYIYIYTHTRVHVEVYIYTFRILYLSLLLMINDLMKIQRTYNPKPDFQPKTTITSQLLIPKFINHVSISVTQTFLSLSIWVGQEWSIINDHHSQSLVVLLMMTIINHEWCHLSSKTNDQSFNPWVNITHTSNWCHIPEFINQTSSTQILRSHINHHQSIDRILLHSHRYSILHIIYI